MFKSFGAGISALFTGIIGLAVLAVVLSNNASTANVVSAFFSGLTSLISTTVAPVTKGSTTTSSSVAGSNGTLTSIEQGLESFAPLASGSTGGFEFNL